MPAFLSRVMSSRLQAIVWIAFTAIVALMLAPLSFLLGLQCVPAGLVGLATLRQGYREGGVVLLGALALAVTATWLVLNSPMPAVMMALTLWLPTWLLTGALRATSALGGVLSSAGAALALAVLGFRVVIGDPGAWWVARWGRMLAPLREATERSAAEPAVAERGGDTAAKILADSAPGGEQMLPELTRALEMWAPVTTGIMAAGFLFMLILIVFLSRWGHGVLDNPGGFGKEFRELAMPRILTYVTLGFGAMVVLGGGGWAQGAGEVVMIALVLHMMHGLAVVHSVVHRMALARGWLVLLYALLFLMPLSSFVVMLLATVGLSDSWVRYRERVPAGTV